MSKPTMCCQVQMDLTPNKRQLVCEEGQWYCDGAWLDPALGGSARYGVGG
jgi:hypothetical protein